MFIINKTQKQLETMTNALVSVSFHNVRAGTYCRAVLPTKAIPAGMRDLLVLSKKEQQETSDHCSPQVPERRL